MEKIVIKSKSSIWDFKLKEIWKYRDLIFLFVKRNYATRYKQMVLGPLWLIISPLFTMITYTIVFGGIAGLSTDGVPKPLFYLAGNIIWAFFSSNVGNVSNTFLGNSALFGKVYFSRMVVPISTSITGMIDFLIQFLMFIVLSIFYAVTQGEIYLNWYMLLIPIVLIQLALLSLGVGIIISSLTTKYRDLTVLVGFGLQIWMYISPVIYSLSLVPENWMKIFLLNPVTPAIMVFKYAVLGIGYIPYDYWLISWGVTLALNIIGLMLFNKIEKTFMDTV